MAPPFRRYSSLLSILFLSLQWFAVEPTVIEGSTYVLPSGSFTGALTDVNLSGLFDGTPTLTKNNNNPAAAIVTSASNSSPIIASTTITNSPVIETPPVSSPPSEKQVAKTNDDNDQAVLSTGVIVGIVVGGIVVIMLTVLLCVFMVRRKKNKKFDRGRGITSSMVISMRTKTPSLLDPMKTSGNEMGFHKKPVQMYYPEHSNMMMTQPSESITAAIDKMYNVKQYNTRSAAFSSTATIPHTPNTVATTTTRDSTVNNNSNPRLSKYSYLAQAFTQMRESYAAHSSLSPPPPESSSSTSMPSSGHHVTLPHHTKNNTTDTTYLRAPDNMDDMDDDDNNNNHNNNNNPTTTATASPYHPTSLTPTPPRIAIFNENSEQVDNSYHSPDGNNDRNFQELNNSTLASSSLSTTPNRDSVTSDVSQYSTFSNPFRYPSPDNASIINNYNNHHQTTSIMMADSRMPTPPRPSPSHQQFRSPRKQYNYI
ncbi:hypothetical protein INT45_003900 [Circinella minor]|uniref:Mid2 domain-containing protein n=1 Tax=Circinella minor TaxID=1195481 RepID=A0A8H7SCT6_9FUNG|nr:hypothetical protein INT45_003900 [Circinella minor]